MLDLLFDGLCVQIKKLYSLLVEIAGFPDTRLLGQ